MSGNQIWAIMIFIAVMAVLFFLLMNKNKSKSVFEAAKSFGMNYWLRNYHEELSRDGSQGDEGYFDKETPLYGFSMKRKTGPKIGQYAVFIVKKTTNGFDITKDKETPTPDEIADPFRIHEGFLFRSPVPIEPMPKYLANMTNMPYKNSQVSVNIGPEKKPDEFKKMGGN